MPPASASAAAMPKRTCPDPDGPTEIPEWDFHETIKSGYWFVKHCMAWRHYSKDAAPGWYDTALTYTRSNVSLTRPSTATVPFTEFYNFTFASYECSGADGELCADLNLKIDGYPTFNLYKDGIFIEQWGGGDHDMFMEGFALFVEEFFSENFPGARRPIDLSAPWSAEARKAAEEETKMWAPNTAILWEEMRERTSEDLGFFPGFEKGTGDNAEEKIEDTVEDGREGAKEGTEGVEEMAVEAGGVPKNPKDDIGDEGVDIEIKSNEELDEKTAGKSSAIDRLHRFIKGIFHIHPGWYNKQVTY